MYFAKSLLVGATALVAFVAAQGKLQFTDAPSGAQAGKSYKLTWSGGSASAATTILLREGPSNNLKTVSTITSSATGGSFTWDVPANLPASGDYALQISQDGQAPNFWNVGAISGGSATASASASVSSSASSLSSSVSSKVSSVSSSLSSVASSLSSKLSSATATKSSLSAGVTGSSSTRNSTTITRATLSSTKHASSTISPSSTESGSSSSDSSAAAAPSSTGNVGAGLKSNAALVLGAVAAMAYLG